jgi:hypothetical protein
MAGRVVKAFHNAMASTENRNVKVFAAVSMIVGLATTYVVFSGSTRGQIAVSQDKPETGPRRDFHTEQQKMIAAAKRETS